MADVAAAYLAAGEAFVALAEQPAVAAGWERDSAVRGFSVGGLVAHTVVAIRWLGPLLEADEPADPPRPLRLGGYYAGMKITGDADFGSDMHTLLRGIGNDRAERGPAAVVDQLRRTLARHREQLAAASNDRIVDLRPLVPGVMHLEDFVHTRTLEFVIHGDDLAVSVGLELQAPTEALDATLHTLLQTARGAHGDLAVLRAFSRGERAPEGVFPVF